MATTELKSKYCIFQWQIIDSHKDLETERRIGQRMRHENEYELRIRNEPAIILIGERIMQQKSEMKPYKPRLDP